MSARNDIFQNILQAKNNAQDLLRRDYLRNLYEHTNRDTIIYATAFASKKLPQIPPYLVSITNEDIQGFISALEDIDGKYLDLIIHSPGGSSEVVDQIVQYLRSKYEHIRAIIPQNAMSAATMLACAADVIVMGKHSAIGPIDPQITFPTQNGHFTAPAQSIIDEFNRAKEEVTLNPKISPLWISKMKDFSPGLLTICDDTIANSIDKVAEWLSAYMLKDDDDRLNKSRSIAEWLGNAKEHRTHGRPIMKQAAIDKGIIIEDLESDPIFQERVMDVFHATMCTFDITNCMKFVENHTGKGYFVNVKIEKN